MSWTPETNTTPWGLLTKDQQETLKKTGRLAVWSPTEGWVLNSANYSLMKVYRARRALDIDWGERVEVDGAEAVVLCVGDTWFNYVLKGQRFIRRAEFNKVKVVRLS